MTRSGCGVVFKLAPPAQGGAWTETVLDTSPGGTIKATVPIGATTGYVTVTTPSSPPTSNVQEIVGGLLIPTTTNLLSSLNPFAAEAAVTFTAIVTSANGPVPNGPIGLRQSSIPM